MQNLRIMAQQFFKNVGSDSRRYLGALSKSCVESLNILCIIVHNQKENEDDKSIPLF